MENIIILDDMSYVRYRVKEVLEEKDIKVYEASTSFEFFNKLSEKKDNIDLIILEIGLIREDGIEVIEKIKEKNIDIPVMILTKMNTRESFAKAVKNGASDYVLKPFDNRTLLDRILKLIKTNETKKTTTNDLVNEKNELKKQNTSKEVEEEESTQIENSSNLPEDFMYYFMEQLAIAQENDGYLSAIIFTLIKNTNEKEKIDVKQSYIILTDIVYKGIKDIFKDPCLLVKHGFMTFLGVMPSYRDIDLVKLKEKINEKYDVLSTIHSKLSDYHIEMSFVSYPQDGEDSEELMDDLINSMKYKIENNKNSKEEK